MQCAEAATWLPLLLVLFGCLALSLPWCKRRTPRPACLFGAASSRTVGNYGFISMHLDSSGVVDLVRQMMDELHVTNVQCYDWFPNYSRRYQAFVNVAGLTKGKRDVVATAQPNWWTSERWKDPWFFSQFNSGALTPSELARFIRNEANGKELGRNEMKCFLSHEACWAQIAHSSRPSLVLEDDVSLPYGFSSVLMRIMSELDELLRDPDYVRRKGGVCVRLGSAGTPATRALTPVAIPVGGCLATFDFETGAWAYILTPRGAQLLGKPQPSP